MTQDNIQSIHKHFAPRLSKATRFLLSIILILGILPITTIASSTKAWADEVVVGQTFTGRCDIGNSYMVGNVSYFNVSGFSGIIGEKGTSSAILHCLNPTAAEPYPQNAPYTATVTKIDQVAQTVTVEVVITPAGATDGVTSNGQGLVGYQRVGGELTLKWEFNGNIDLLKLSANPNHTSGNSLYSLMNAKYGVFTDANCTNLKTTMTTDASGYATATNLPQGIYYIKEISASQGYELDPTVYATTVRAGQTTRVNNDEVKETPQMGYIDLNKKSMSNTITDDNECYSLQNAKYGIYKDSALTQLVEEITTNASGYAKSAALPLGTYYIKEAQSSQGYWIDQNIYSVSVLAGNQVVTVNSTNVYEEPKITTVEFFIEKIDSETGTQSQGQATLEGAEFKASFYPTQFSSAKDALDSGDAMRTWIFRSDAEGVIKFNEDYLVSGDQLFKNENNNVVLPLGTLVIEETKAPIGYVLDEAQYIINIEDDGSINPQQSNIVFSALTQDNAVENQVIRGDLEFVKSRESDQARLSNIPFKITSQTTGESHIVVTDQNGYVNTSASWNQHTNNTNANDLAIDENGNVNESMLDASAGIWFGDISRTSDSLGALIYDTYTIEELHVSKNTGLELVTLKDITITRHDTTINLGTIVNLTTPVPSIKTIARDKETDSKTALSTEQTTLIDRIDYKNLATTDSAGQKIYYTIKTTLIDKASGEVLKNTDGSNITTQTQFSPEASEGYLEVEVTFDASNYAGLEVVFFEQLYREGEDTPCATHEDINDYFQSITLQKIGNLHTVARSESGDKSAAADINTLLIDRVYYSGLNDNGDTAYRLKATLMDASNGNVVTDQDGNPIQKEITFTPQAASGYVEVSIEFNSLAYAGKDVVFFEELFKGDLQTPIAEHKDLNDYYQTITLLTPSITTKAIDASSGTKTMSATSDQLVKDTVTFDNLVAGDTYTLESTLMLHEFYSFEDNADNIDQTDPNVVFTQDGYWRATELNDDSHTFPIITEFIPDATSGSTEVFIPIDASTLHGKSIVVYQRLLKDGIEIATHMDASSIEQSLLIQRPVIVSKLTSDDEVSKATNVSDSTRLIDHFDYNNVVWGQSYALYGMLVNPETKVPYLKAGYENSIDEQTLLAFTAELLELFGEGSDTNDDGSFNAREIANLDELFAKYDNIKEALILTSNQFIPTSYEGKTTIEYEFDSTHLANKSATSIALLVNDENGNVEATEHDLTNTYQTLNLTAPEISTKAYNPNTVEQTIEATSNATIIDEVEYKNLEVGTEYTVEGILYDKQTESPILVNGREVTSTTKFSAVAPNGSIVVDFDFDATSLSGKDLVVFEKLYADINIDNYAQKTEIAAHEDINSIEQTVSVASNNNTTSKAGALPKTGDVAAVGILVAGLATTLAAIYLRKQKRRQAQHKA